MNKVKINNKGFTLMELLVVIAIIGLLSSMTTYFVNSARIRARDARRLADIRQIQSALELYYDDNLQYPPVADAQTSDDADGCGKDDTWCDLEQELVPKYIGKLPRDPSGLQNIHRYYYDADSGDNYQTYGLMCLLESGIHEKLASNDGGYWLLFYEVGQQPNYCVNKYTTIGDKKWLGSGFIPPESYGYIETVCFGGN